MEVVVHHRMKPQRQLLEEKRGRKRQRQATTTNITTTVTTTTTCTTCTTNRIHPITAIAIAIATAATITPTLRHATQCQHVTILLLLQLLLCTSLSTQSTQSTAFTTQATSATALLRGTTLPSPRRLLPYSNSGNSRTELRSSLASSAQGLSRYYQGMLSRTCDRQRFVTGKYPIIVTIQENPTRKWLSLGRNNAQKPGATTSLSTSELFVNGTAIDKSLASYSRYQWLDDEERQQLHNRYRTVSIELLAEIHVAKPGYVQISPSSAAGSTAAAMRNAGSNSGHSLWNSPWKQSAAARTLYNELEDLRYGNAQFRDRLWVSGFTLASRKGIIKSVDITDGHIDTVNERSESMALWPNEINHVPSRLVKPTATTASMNRHKSFKPVSHHHHHAADDHTHHRSISSHEQHTDHQPTSHTSVSHAASSHTSVSASTSLHSTIHDAIAVERKQQNRDAIMHTPHHSTRHHSTSAESSATTTTSTVKIDIPNALTFANNEYEDALLVSDGFLVPGKDRGGIYIVKNPSNVKAEWTVCLTDSTRDDRWFYHRAVWVDLTGDGRQSILTARAKLRQVSGSGKKGNAKGVAEEATERPRNGELVWLEMPQPHSFDAATGTPLDEDGTPFDPFDAAHLPWKERVLATGPDVMFNVADMDPDDDTIEVIASQFFDKKVTLHSIQRGPQPKVVFSRIIDDRCGAAFGGILADLDCGSGNTKYNSIVIDSGSTVPSVKPGDAFSHVLVTSHECNFAEKAMEGVESLEQKYQRLEQQKRRKEVGCAESAPLDGGSLFSYRIPASNKWKTDPWIRTTVATGFKVKGQLWNLINPGAPGFVYTFHARKEDRNRPMIAVAGDCAESAYIFRPEEVESSRSSPDYDRQAQYKLMCEIKCGATVGSIGVGYDDLCSEEQESGYAKLYIPCYEQDKVLVFALGSGEDAYEEDEHVDDGW